MNICLFSSEELKSPLDIRDERAQHIIKVLHKKEGDSFAAGIIGGKAGRATIRRLDFLEEKSADGKKTFKAGFLYFDFEGESDGKPLFPLKMIIGFPRPIQLKRLLRDMAGLGVSEVHLTATELGEKSYLKSALATSDAGKKMLLEGSVQAASTHIPALFMHDSLEKCLDAVESGGNSGALQIKAALDNVDANQSLVSFMKEAGSAQGAGLEAIAAIGSERGWTDKERKLLEIKGYKRLSMGMRVLRTETAATVAASLMLGSMGFLN